MADTIGDTQYYLILFFLWAFLSLLLHYLLKKPIKPSLHLPPSPPALPLIGHLHLLRPMAFKCLHNISSKHGPFLCLRLGSRPVLVVSSATFAAEIFKTHDINFSAKPKTPLGDKLLFGNFGFFNAPYGDYWKFMKKLCMTELLGARQVERDCAARREELRRFLSKLVERACKNENVDLGNELMRLTNNTICRMVMSTRCSGEDDEARKCRELVEESVDLAGKLGVASMLGPLKKLGFWVFRKQLKDILRDFDELLEKILKEHEEKAKRDGDDHEGEDKDLMDILLKVYQDENAEFKISRNHMKAFFLDLFFAGTDTSANTMQWIMAELINHPKVFSKLREEIESVVGTNRLVEESDIPNLHYLQAVVKETMRLHPLVPAIPRECREDCKIEGYDIPKETVVWINVYSIMRDPKLWNNPNEFCPERFLQEHENQKEIKRQNFSFLPFGGGRRMCPGSHLAFSLINITIASMIQCFDWKAVGDGGKVNMEAKSGFSLCLAHPLLCFPVIHYHPFAA
ncbi:hypothetical protein P3X46_024295 [Hevea brasiliensis]|uniref:Cytochrome P450 n=1 Tax=Hevea brasiliensis TaxID=3981 RepID=A0ABQ9L340_HEVBR|nr:cytochrome P450 705A22-like [Hevea brasiliensis]KAJ9158738.1 hypothetical protein P3X46_024295 [Hevea brasiliensis]